MRSKAEARKCEVGAVEAEAEATVSNESCNIYIYIYIITFISYTGRVVAVDIVQYYTLVRVDRQCSVAYQLSSYVWNSSSYGGCGRRKMTERTVNDVLTQCSPVNVTQVVLYNSIYYKD